MISGQYVDKFSEANLATAVDVSMNGDYDFFFEVVAVHHDLAGQAETVILKPEGGGENWVKPVQRKNGREFITYVHMGAYTAMMGGKGERVKVVPFLGKKS